jgi:hypothetical protein
MYSLLLLTVLAQPAREPAALGDSPPEQVLASIDGKGKLTITSVSSGCFGSVSREHTVQAQEAKGMGKVPVKVKVASLVVTTAELPARFVEAYTTDGKAISTETLANLLAKERTVLVALDGKKVDPFYLQLYKEGTIVLVPPANTLNLGGPQAYVMPFGGAYAPPPHMPEPERIAPPRPEPLPAPRNRP